jgi:hypothetical protein
MPIWLYEISPLKAAIIMVVITESVSLLGLVAARRFLLPRFHYSDGINEAISGTVQAIGVFYGVTVGLIAVAVWNTNTNCSDLVSREAATIGTLYRDVSGYPEPLRTELRAKLREHTVIIIEKSWPAQVKGDVPTGGDRVLDELQDKLYSFQPNNPGMSALHSETLRAFNNLIESRRLRILAVDGGLSTTMWVVIWIGAAISIGVAYFFKVEDVKLHAILVSFIACFLALVIFLIAMNDKPFFGAVSVSSDPYKNILERLIDR